MNKECLNCKKEFEAKKDTAKYCSDSCRVMWNRSPLNKKEKGLTDLQQMKVMYNSLMEKIDKLSFPTIQVQPSAKLVSFDGIVHQVEEKQQNARQSRTPAHWVELRRECESADDYAKWLQDLESDIFLTTREKSLIKQTV